MATPSDNPNARMLCTDHPTPQFRRNNFRMLNGKWDFAMDQRLDRPDNYPEAIIVPFAVETEASGIARSVAPEDVLHYRTFIKLEEIRESEEYVLHFEAVDQVCDVYLNGELLGHHEGGYFPFEFSLGNAKVGNNVIEVTVQDNTDSDLFPRGKQNNEYGGIWYKPTSGIWGNVWFEKRPKGHIRSIKLLPDFDKCSIRINIDFDGEIKSGTVLVVCPDNHEISHSFTDSELDFGVQGHFFPWSPYQPDLYAVRLRVNDDEIYSYFAMRKFSIVEKDGHKVFGLNNKPLFLTGPLDQGYWQNCGMTPPSDQALIDDIELIKSMGFNMLRKHIKIEPMRWYYHCDRLGVIVIQDFLNGGSRYSKFLINTAPFIRYKFNDLKTYKRLGRGNPESRKAFENDMKPFVDLLYNVPCIGVWTLFNEGWGQFDAIRLTEELRKLDDSRPIDSTSGWYDQRCGDFESRHIYFRPVKLHHVKGRALCLSEFGGYSLYIEGHTKIQKKSFGYKTFDSQAKFATAIRSLWEKQLIPLVKKAHLSIAVYTQLSDVEDEINGLITFDRKIIKIDPQLMKDLNRRLSFDE